MKSNIRPFVAAAMSLAFCLPAQAVTAFTSLHSFGDSLSDSGNVYAATGETQPASPPNYPGRFGNGPTWVEKLATDHLGIPAITPSFAGGTNHAWGGAWTDGGGSVPTVIGQINQYIGAGGTFGATDLVTIWAGANDFFFGVTDPAAPVANIGTALGLLAGAGAQNILLMNLPDLSRTPDIQALPASSIADFSSLVNGYNAFLAAEIANQRAALGINLIEVDVFALNESVMANPGDYGYADTINKGIDDLANAESYVFWDGVHPENGIHDLFAAEAAQALGIPEPSSTLLILSVSFAGILRRRRVAA